MNANALSSECCTSVTCYGKDSSLRMGKVDLSLRKLITLSEVKIKQVRINISSNQCNVSCVDNITYGEKFCRIIYLRKCQVVYRNKSNGFCSIILNTFILIGTLENKRYLSVKNFYFMSKGFFFFQKYCPLQEIKKSSFFP